MHLSNRMCTAATRDGRGWGSVVAGLGWTGPLRCAALRCAGRGGAGRGGAGLDWAGPGWAGLGWAGWVVSYGPSWAVDRVAWGVRWGMGMGQGSRDMGF